MRSGTCTQFPIKNLQVDTLLVSHAESSSLNAIVGFRKTSSNTIDVSANKFAKG